MGLRIDLTLWVELVVRLVAGVVAVAERTSASVVDRLGGAGVTSVPVLVGWVLLAAGAVTLIATSASALRRRG